MLKLLVIFSNLWYWKSPQDLVPLRKDWALIKPRTYHKQKKLRRFQTISFRVNKQAFRSLLFLGPKYTFEIYLIFSLRSKHKSDWTENNLSYKSLKKSRISAQRLNSGPRQISKMEYSAKIVNIFYSLTSFAKHSMFDVWQRSEYTSAVNHNMRRLLFG